MPTAAACELPAGGAGAQPANGLPAGPDDPLEDGPQLRNCSWVPANIKEAGHLMSNTFTLDLLEETGALVELPVAHILWLIKNRTVEQHAGGEAVVHIVRWDTHGFKPTITDGAAIAIKLYCHPAHKGQAPCVWDEVDLRRQVFFCQRMLRQEVNILDILQKAGCADFIPAVEGVFRHPGSLQRDKDPPLYGYAMAYYKHGSLAQFLQRTCDRATPASVFGSFFAPAQLSGHYHKLHNVLLRLSTAKVPPHLIGPSGSTRRGLLLQDISSNNLLLKEVAAGAACELLFSDPSRAQLAAHLEEPSAKRYITATWLWGCMAAQHAIVDETADVFSTNMCMLEVWGVAEGTPMPFRELASCLRLDSNRAKGVTLLRALCTGMLKRHAMGSSCGIVPRTCRELPLSWLMLWSILLGCDDFHSKEELDSGRRHRRPSVADMADVASHLAAVATQMEALDGGVSAAALDTPAGAALVRQCVQLYSRLAALTRLDDPALLPVDASLRWVATRFLQQDHPLVAAMKAQGAVTLGKESERAIETLHFKDLDFLPALLAAETEASWVGNELEIGDMVAAETQKLRLMCQEYRQCQLDVLRLVPDDSAAARMLRSRQAPPELQPFMEGLPPLPPPAPSGVQPPAASAADVPAAAVALLAAAGGAAPAATVPATACHATVPAAAHQPAAAAAAPAAALAQAASDASTLGAQPAQPCLAAMGQPGAAALAGLAAPPLAAPMPQAPVPTAALASQPGVASAAVDQQVPAPQPLLPSSFCPQQAAPLPVLPASQAGLTQPGSAAPAPYLSALAALQLAVPTAGLAAVAGHAAAGQPTLGSQACFNLLQHQQPPAGQTCSGWPAAAASPHMPAAPPAPPMSPAPAGADWPWQLSAGFGVGPSSGMDMWTAVPGALPLSSWGLPSMHPQIAGGAAAAGAALWERQITGAAAGSPGGATAAAVLSQPESPSKKRRLGQGGSAASGPPASPAPPLLPRPCAYCDLFVKPGPVAASQPAVPGSAPPAWLRLLRERGWVKAAAELDRLAAGAGFSSEGRRLAGAVATGLQMKPRPRVNYKKSEVTRYADALKLLVTSERPPPGLEAQFEEFRPVDTAAKLAWFLGWWASKDSNAPHIAGLSMECSNKAKKRWTKAVLDAAEADGVFRAEVEPAHTATMPFATQALLRQLLVDTPLFAAAVAMELEEM